MIKKTIILAALAFGSAAFAFIEPCPEPLPKAFVPYYEKMLNPVPYSYVCSPTIAGVGTGTPGILGFSEFGGALYWYCPLADATWVIHLVPLNWTYLNTVGIASSFYNTAISPMSVPLINKYVADYIKLPLSDPSVAAIWCPWVDDMVARWPQGIPTVTPPSGWVVAKNGTLSTRASFAVVNGVRSFSSKTTIPVGAPCSESIKLIEGQLTFLQVAPALVAVCTKAP
jgi:hypothetical protein